MYKTAKNSISVQKFIYLETFLGEIWIFAYFQKFALKMSKRK